MPVANTAARNAVVAAYIAALNAIPDGTAENDGVAAGRAAARAILTARLNDGSGSPHTPAYTAVPAAGVYVSTVPFGSAAPQFNHWSATRPFVVQSATQFRVPPGEIFDLSSDAYADAYNQVKDLGDARTRGARPDSPQSDIARFWYHGGVDWQANARLILPGFNLDAWGQARALALMSVSMADAGIANAESKYWYTFWRPVTAIRWASDGNPNTQSDPSWLPFITIPPYPDYPCGSTGAAGAATGALRLVLGTNHAPFTRTVNVPALPLANQMWPAGLPGVPAKAITRTYSSLSNALNEVGRSRVYAGIHFLEGCQAGGVQGEMTAEYIYPRILQPVD
ncbi:vanadium-dependent haloperoxidase [Lysobacter solisilvae (ex Woo and Kim 2020)]|uniref:Vanadium-dependent haloperoxidase n=1 Tax=Agrilutibacter terrestris TaxID=2865112 RepID=A0A7H0FY48_9GAMM|nr:vanadium-dependent haloperoxidase [Lysobacter terrestris]QNP40964.1 vanadium-dependent haloperoxidase [Lysobacter terrestris]